MYYTDQTELVSHCRPRKGAWIEIGGLMKWSE